MLNLPIIMNTKKNPGAVSLARLRRTLVLMSVALLSLQGCRSQAPVPASATHTASRHRWDRPSDEGIRRAFEQMPVYDPLETFQSRAEFEAYRKRIGEIAASNGLGWLTHRSRIPTPILLAAAQTKPCDPATENCPDELQEVITTGQRVSRPVSITNNQVSDVDEGDVVKSWGRFLIVLHDARLFSVDLGESPGRLRLADRVNAYQESDTDAWYDELLIKDNHVLVTGYSYTAGQAEYSVFDIDDAGRLKLASRFFIKSEDYFSGGNYASRLVGGRLVIYNPIDLGDLGAGQADVPQLRSWRPGRGFTAWRPLLAATDIYRPVDRSLNPTLHVLSVCPILSNSTGECESRAIVAPRHRELYVSAQAAYLWIDNESAADYVWSDRPDCGDDPSRGVPRARLATVFQVPLGAGDVTAVRARGDPPDQFAMERRATTLYALVRRVPDGACTSEAPPPLELFTIPQRLFSDRPRVVAERYVHAQPQVGEGYVSARFATDYLNYGAGRGWWTAYWGHESQEALPVGFVSVPLHDPDHALKHQLTHSVERVELLGDSVVVFGINAKQSLGVSTVDLRAVPAVADVLDLPGALESEGRSHAFNAQVEDDGSGVFGLPTQIRTGTKSRHGYEETEDQVTYFTADRTLHLRTPGSLEGDRLPENSDYTCEVSCIDWYGNTRPIFYKGRVFALIGREFAEGRIDSGHLIELARVDLTSKPAQ